MGDYTWRDTQCQPATKFEKPWRNRFSAGIAVGGIGAAFGKLMRRSGPALTKVPLSTNTSPTSTDRHNFSAENRKRFPGAILPIVVFLPNYDHRIPDRRE